MKEKKPTFDEIVDRFKELTKQGFIKTHRAGDNGIGKTLEDELGIPENNIQGPDGEATEVKGARKNSSSNLSLFTKNPLPRGINSKLRQAYGHPDATYAPKLSLHCTVTTTKPNPEGFILIGKTDRIELAFTKKQTKVPNLDTPYWKQSTLEKAIKRKYADSLFYAKAKTRGSGTDEEFHFIEAYHLQGLSFKNFSKNLDQGILVAEPRMGFNGPNTKKPGSPHDHGTAFRINPSLLDKIFAKSIRVV